MHSIQKIDLVNETSETSFHKAPSNLGLDLGICFKTLIFLPGNPVTGRGTSYRGKYSTRLSLFLTVQK